MNDVQVGRRFRAIRHRLAWRQRDVAARAKVSQSVVSFVERGRFDRVSVDAIRRVASVLEAEVEFSVRWRGGDLDRLVDEGHAELVGAVLTALREGGWKAMPEVSYSEYGERGSIDILAWHPPARTLLVVEIKTELVSLEATLRKHHEKARLAPRIARGQFGWQAVATSRLLVFPDASTPRRRARRHESVLQVACPLRGSAIRTWLKAPTDPISGLMFVQPATRRLPSRKRIRCSRAA